MIAKKNAHNMNCFDGFSLQFSLQSCRLRPKWDLSSDYLPKSNHLSINFTLPIEVSRGKWRQPRKLCAVRKHSKALNQWDIYAEVAYSKTECTTIQKELRISSSTSSRRLAKLENEQRGNSNDLNLKKDENN